MAFSRTRGPSQTWPCGRRGSLAAATRKDSKDYLAYIRLREVEKERASQSAG